jgi:sporulation protein YlmC with PRC-barrel domain
VIAGPGFAQEQTQGATTGREATGDAQMQVGGAGAAGGDFYTANPSDFLGSALMGAAVYAPSADAAEGGDAAMQDEAAAPAAGDAGMENQAAAGEAPATGEATDDLAEAGDAGQPAPGQGTAGMSGEGFAAVRTAEDAEMQNMESIGSVEDVVIDEQGSIQAVVVDVGGFLGIGSRRVALDLSALELVESADGSGELSLTSQLTAETLESAPEFELAAVEGDGMAGGDAAGDGAMQPMAGAEQPAAEGEMAATDGGADWRGDRAPLTAPGIEREGYQLVEANEFAIDNLMGASVYDVNDESIGSVTDAVASQDGAIEHVVLDVGGFLGFGTHTVAVGIDEMTVLTTPEGDDVRVYVDVTREQLEAMPEYTGDAT